MIHFSHKGSLIAHRRLSVLAIPAGAGPPTIEAGSPLDRRKWLPGGRRARILWGIRILISRLRQPLRALLSLPDLGTRGRQFQRGREQCGAGD